MKTKLKRLSELSIFFPAYNEAGNIEEVVKQALAVASKVAKKFEIVIINDGSTDSTLQISKRLAKKYPKVRVVTQTNRGYGGALKRGFKEAQYEWVFFTDSDLQFDISEIIHFIEYVDESDLVIGYRLERAEGWKRHLLTSALKVWNRIMLNFPKEVKDIDCAFKLIHKRVLVEIEPLFSDGAMISTEMLLKTYRMRFNITQVGVQHYQRFIGQPTGNSTKVILKAVAETLNLQWQLFKQDLSLQLSRASSVIRLALLNR